MKANNGKGNTPLRDMWITPSEIFNPVKLQYGINFDCCADKENRKTQSYSDDFLNITNIREDFVCWMNPPFSKAWKMFEHFFKVVKKGVAIYRCDNLETGLWQKVIFPNADWIFFPKGRVNYEGLDGSGSRFPSALIGVGLGYPKNIDGFVLHKLLDDNKR